MAPFTTQASCAFDASGESPAKGHFCARDLQMGSARNGAVRRVHFVSLCCKGVTASFIHPRSCSIYCWLVRQAGMWCVPEGREDCRRVLNITFGDRNSKGACVPPSRYAFPLSRCSQRQERETMMYKLAHTIRLLLKSRRSFLDSDKLFLHTPACAWRLRSVYQIKSSYLEPATRNPSFLK